jgi:hypothetical protein
MQSPIFTVPRQDKCINVRGGFCLEIMILKWNKGTVFNLVMTSDICYDLENLIYRISLIYFVTYTGCNRRNGPNFGRVFLMLIYTDITQNTYIQSFTIPEIMAIEKCGVDVL